MLSEPRGRESQPLCLRLTATATLRLDDAVAEHLSTGADLAAWFSAVGLTSVRPAVDGALLQDARNLREAIYRIARSRAAGEPTATADRRLINEWASRNDAARVLDDFGSAHWQLPKRTQARSALAVVATDAVDTLGGTRDGVIKVCAGHRCAAVFLDTSRGRTRRWCSMGTCGNRAKRSAMQTRRQTPG